MDVGNKSWHEYCFTNRLTLLEGAIANAMREENIDKFIVGIENTRQLVQIIDASKNRLEIVLKVLNQKAMKA